MILELTEIDLKPGHMQLFEKAVASCDDLFQRSEGWYGLELHRSREIADRCYLLVAWKSVEHHTVSFWQSQDFQLWRARVSEHFLRKPVVQHLDMSLSMGASFSRFSDKTQGADTDNPQAGASSQGSYQGEASSGHYPRLPSDEIA